MIFKAFRAKKKIFCRALIAALAINFLDFGSLVFAMVDGDCGIVRPIPSRVVAQNPFINETDSEGYTVLMRAIEAGNARLVKECLEQGASVCVMPPALQNRYSNVFEYLCDKVVKTYKDKLKDGEYSEIDSEIPAEIRKAYYDIFDIIVRYHIENNIPLSINLSMLGRHDERVFTVWDCHGKWGYWELDYEHPDLFKVV